MRKTLQIDKYTIVYDKTNSGPEKILKDGEEWRNSVLGDNLLSSLCAEVETLRNKQQERDEPQPLSIEELIKISEDPFFGSIWVMNLKTKALEGCFILSKHIENQFNPKINRFITTGCRDFFDHQCGITWQAYAHMPRF